ncbi:MAG: hypothetical protein HYX41_06310 [Bdellovibrio sp.]|nr:hypothetical protein [Bdellovibrio sp.]
MKHEKTHSLVGMREIHPDHRVFGGKNGIHFIRVKGDLSERAIAHARLLRKELHQGAIPALIKKNEWLIRTGPGLVKYAPVQDAIVAFYTRVVIPLLDRQSPAHVKAALKKISEESGIPYKDMRETLFQADGLMVLVKLSLSKHFLSEWIPGGFPACTSGVALKSATQGGKLLACRNFDYLIVGPWERFPTVVFNEPTESGSIPFVSLTSAGVQSGGVTSINHEGITLFAHAHFANRVSLRGQSVVSIGDEVITHSKTLGQAIDIFKKKSPCANWAFVVSSGKENQAAVVEVSPGKVRVREPQNEILAHSNFFHDPELHRAESLLCGSYCEDLEARYGRMKQVLHENLGKLTPQILAKTLSEHRDFFSGQERVFGNTVSVVTTVKSAVFEPESLRFWMAHRSESPVGLGGYLKVDMDRFWKQDAETLEDSTEILPGYQSEAPGFTEGVRHYREAYRSYHMDCDQPDFKEKTLENVKKAIEAYPSDGHLWLQAGYLAFKLKKFTEAEGFFAGTLNHHFSPHVAQVRDLYLARCFDLRGARKMALELYQSHPRIQEPKLRRAFKKGLKRPYRAAEVEKIVLDMQFPDTFQY